VALQLLVGATVVFALSAVLLGLRLVSRAARSHAAGAVTGLGGRVLRRLRSTRGKLEYAIILVVVAGTVALVLSVVHHDTPNVFSNISMGY
jgi:hypothetical protein